MHTLHALDLSPLPEDLSDEDHAWLGLVQRHVRASDHLVKLGDAAAADDGEDYIVSRDAFGRWWTGRYIGDLSFNGRRLEIRPRLGDIVIEDWLAEVFNLVAVPDSAAQQHSESFIARLMGAVWCRALGQAARHGPPSFRREHLVEGVYVRGRVDVRRTARLRAQGSPHVASLHSYRDLDNDVSRTLVAAERVLSARIGHTRWRTPRVDEMLPWLTGAVGARPRLPTRSALQRIRYSPITRPFKAVADLSWRLAQLQGYTAASEEGRSEGLLVDAAELWELFVVKCLQRALPELRVEHGTIGGETTWLMRSIEHPHLGLGRLKPDVLAYRGEKVHVVADAKYKRLENRWPERPQGYDRADAYQLTSYLARYSPHGDALGMLVYPRDKSQDELAHAELRGPWRLENDGVVRFLRLGVGRDEAVQEMRELLADLDALQPAAA